jgi:uncharacterized membrane protein AbrB (regulator of aidB expression)
MDPIKGLFRSRKFLLALLAFIQSMMLYYFDVPESIFMSGNALIAIVIAGIAYEDGKEKGNPAINDVYDDEE